MSINFDFSHCVVDSCNLDIFSDSIFEPAFQDGDLAPLFELIDEFFHWDCRAHNFEYLLDIAFLAFKVDESTQDNWDGLRVLVNFKEINFDVFGEVVLVEIASKFIVLLVSIAKEDDWLGIS